MAKLAKMANKKPQPKTSKKPALKVVPPPGLLLDLGCGNEKLKRPGFIGVDIAKRPGVDQVVNLAKKWPWKDESVEEVHCSHLIEHLEPMERAHFFNELERVLRTGGRAVVVTPHWASQRAYADPTHKWPPVCEQFYMNLDKKYRDELAPEMAEYFKTSLLSVSQSYKLVDWLATRNDEFKNFAISAYKEVCMDLIVNIIKKPPEA
jgi:predicted SAM-dependent methyltransferase